MRPSLEIVRHEQSSDLVQKAFTVQGPEAAAKLTHRLEPYLAEGESVPDIWQLMQLLLRWLTSVTHEMVKADVANELELANDSRHRTLRNETVARLMQTLIALRDSCVSLYGKERIDQLGFVEQTPRNPRVLLNVARKLIELLQSSDYALPPPLFGNLGLDPLAMVEVIEAEIRVLEESLANVDEELKKAQSTQGAKGEKVETYKEGFFWIARWLEASFALAGMMHESERVKPSLRRRGRTEVEPEPDGTVPEPEPTPELGEARDQPEP